MCSDAELRTVMAKLVSVYGQAINFYFALENLPGVIVQVEMSFSSEWSQDRSLGEVDSEGIYVFSATKEFDDEVNRKLGFVWKIEGIAKCRGCLPANTDYRRKLRRSAGTSFSKKDVSDYVNEYIRPVIQLYIKYLTTTDECKKSAEGWSGTFKWL